MSSKLKYLCTTASFMARLEEIEGTKRQGLVRKAGSAASFIHPILTSKTFTSLKPLLSFPICKPTALVMTFSTWYRALLETPF